jgi:hypothetical protein
MRQILLSCALLAVLTAPAVAVAARTSGHGRPGYVVVRKALDDGGIAGRPVVTLVVRGFVLGRIAQEGQVDVVQLPSVSGQGAPQATSGAFSKSIRRGKATGREFTGSNFRFRAMGGLYSVTVRGSGVYLFAGGHGHVTVRGSSRYKRTDGWFSVNGSRFRSLPARPVTLKLGRG